MVFKCKVVYDFQSVEFEYEADGADGIEKMYGIYKAILNGLKDIADETPNPSKMPQKKANKEELASPNQINYLTSLGLPREEAEKLTKKQASVKIKELS